MSQKTVYILGAGFSYPAGIPTQAELLEVALTYKGLSGDLERCKTELLSFIKKVYGISENNSKNLALEDIYTPIHRAISRNEYLKSYSPEDLKSIENCLNRLISHVIDNGKQPSQYRHDYVDDFIQPLMDQKHQARTSDKFSIISLNWDILLDKRLFVKLSEHNDLNGHLDYCTHVMGNRNTDAVMPAILVKSTPKSYAIKLLKLHGSLNWLTCPQCSRLTISKTDKNAITAFTGQAECKHCADRGRGEIKTNATIMLPTFRKDLDSFHFQHIWNQAAIELSEANKLVFIGYSFPLADYDFRNMITKHVSIDTQIEIVLCESDRNKTTGADYVNYFGSQRCHIRYDGVEGYASNPNFNTQ